MPIVTIQFVGDLPDSGPGAQYIQIIADQLGRIFKSDAGTTWVKVQNIKPGYYAENETAPDTRAQPIFVEILKRTLEEHSLLAEEAQQIARVVAHEFSRPAENIHVLYLPEGDGRIAFGGKLQPGKSGQFS